jgi:hypothetical protein
MGGLASSVPTLEYLADKEATSPNVKLIIGVGTSEVVIEDKDFGADYHCRSDLGTLKQGTRLSLSVSECVARIRWIEKIA